MKRFLLLSIAFSWSALGFDLIPNRDLSTGELQIVTAKMSLNGRPFECLVDTGARHTMVQTKFINDFKVVGTTTGGGLSDSNQITELVNADLKVGDWEIKNATIGRTPRIPFECLIGNDFFMTKNFSIDMKNFKVEIAQSNDQEFHQLNIYKNEYGGHFGFNITIADNSIETLFDTGAASTVVDLDFVREHSKHFTLVKEIDVLDGNSATLKAGLYKVDQLQFGDVNLQNVEVYVLDLSGLKNKLPSVVAILGMNIIKDFKWSFNIAESTFNYSKF